MAHLLPELHHCTGLVRGPTTKGAWFRTFEVEAPAYVHFKPARKLTLAEVKDLAYSIAALTAAFTILGARTYLFIDPLRLLFIVPIAFLAVLTAFAFHELAHRFVARGMGYWAEYRAWPLGLLLAVATSFLGMIFAAPGAVYVEGVTSRRDYGVISLVGPLVNLFVAGLLKLTSVFIHVGGLLGLGLWYLADVNLWLGVFNLLPIPPLDGSKVFSWSPVAWVASIGLGVALFIL